MFLQVLQPGSMTRIGLLKPMADENMVLDRSSGWPWYKNIARPSTVVFSRDSASLPHKIVAGLMITHATDKPELFMTVLVAVHRQPNQR